MKIGKILSTVAVITCFSTTLAFAAPEISHPSNATAVQSQSDTKDEKEQKIDRIEQKGECKKDRHDFHKDPVKDLERRKKEVKSLLKEGKISKEKADEIIKKLDDRIKKIKEFNKLPLEKKKEKLINDFKARIDKEIEEGRITKEKADELLKEFTKRIEQWDGKGYPIFYGPRQETRHGIGKRY